MSQPRPRWALALTLLTLAAGSTARAGFVGSLTPTVTSAGVGLYRYDYTLAVDPTSTLTASQLFINLGANSTISNITDSVGWDIGYTTGDTLVSFSSPSASLDLTPGTAGSFEFFSAAGPSSSTFDIRSLDAGGSPLGDFSGPTLAPSSVPEPSSLALVAASVAGGVALFCKRRLLTATA